MTATKPETTRITLLESLSQELLHLSFAAMREVGPAAQSLAGVLRMTKKETFAPVSDIAAKARLPLKTVRNHLVVLDNAGWIVNAGRGHTRAGLPRRTCTIRVAQKARDAFLQADPLKKEPTYGLLPWWATAKFQRVNRKNLSAKNLPWSARALLSVLLGKLAALKSAYEPGVGKSEIDEEEFWGHAANYFSEFHHEFSLTKLQALTGLSKHAIIDGKNHLEDWGFITKRYDRRDDRGGYDTDLLEPNPDFACEHTDADQGRCYLNITKPGRRSA